MALDAMTERQLVEARKRILAQLDELQFRVSGNAGAWGRRGPQDRGDIYDVLKSELDEINRLLEGDKTNGDRRVNLPPPQFLDAPTSEPGAGLHSLAFYQIGLVIIAIGLALAFGLR